ncbi:MAG: hypothetical protein IPK03_03660 [Bacteroidetes bacterium]|nr:hypothetical protein [Bacteroidota bacterium]
MGIIGAGFMGAGIAEVTMDAGIEVKMYDVKEDMLSTAKKTIWGNIQKKIDKRILRKIDAEKMFMSIQSANKLSQIAHTDIIIEAVVEKMEVKKSIIQEVEQLGNASLIFASNTSSLSITEMAEGSKHRDKIIGMHYFSPVPKMPLLEIVKTPYTSDSTLANAYDLGVRQGKTCIVVKDGPGFYVNRILSPYLNECLLMMEEGVSVEQIDRALTSKGFPVGPLKLMDEVGIDIVVHATNANRDYASKRKGYMPNQGLDKMFAAGYLGKKNKKGFYLYDAATGKSTGTNTAILPFFQTEKKRENTIEAICDRAIYLMLKEAKSCLDEGIISSEQDGNLGAIFGIGFMPYTGGPFSMIQSMGHDSFTAKLTSLAANYGARFDPS